MPHKQARLLGLYCSPYVALRASLLTDIGSRYGQGCFVQGGCPRDGWDERINRGSSSECQEATEALPLIKHAGHAALDLGGREVREARVWRGAEQRRKGLLLTDLGSTGSAGWRRGRRRGTRLPKP